MPNFRKNFELAPRLKYAVGRGYSQNQILKVAATICLILAAGLTVNAVRLIVSHPSSNAVFAPAPQVLGATDVKTPAAAANMQFAEYKVQKGDTLFNISQKFNINWTTLATLNNLKSPFTLKTGQLIKIPK